MMFIKKAVPLLSVACAAVLAVVHQVYGAGLTEPEAVFFANPAAVYCEDMGYQYSLNETDEGVVGTCTFPDGTSCNEWDFFAGKCGEAYSYCAQNGYGITTETEGASSLAAEYAVCTDGSGKKVGLQEELALINEKVLDSSCASGEGAELDDSYQSADVYEPEYSAEALPTSFDWRAYNGKNYMTSIKNQGQCGSCWAFAAVGVVEADLNIANSRTGDTYNFSEQYLVSDCLNGNSCCGGHSYTAFGYMIAQGIPDDACMPYVDGVSTGCSCNYSCANCTYKGDNCSDRSCSNRCANYATRLIKIESYQYAGSDEAAIQTALVYQGPLTAYIRMDGSFDSSGRYVCGTDAPINHAVVLVGYNNAGGYWIVKNSWGATWNGDGYFKVKYGECSIENFVYAADVNRTISVPKTPAVSNVMDNTPAYTWVSLPDATTYQVQLRKGTTVVYTKTVLSGACNTTTCTKAFTDTLSLGTYKWRVRAKIDGAWHPWSYAKTFTVVAARPLPKSPGGTITDHTPDFIWTKLNGASSYQVQVIRNGTVVYTKTAFSGVCGTTTCTKDFGTNLIVGSYTWRVRGQVGGVWSPWSGLKTFSITSSGSVPQADLWFSALPVPQEYFSGRLEEIPVL